MSDTTLDPALTPFGDLTPASPESVAAQQASGSCLSFPGGGAGWADVPADVSS